MEANPAGNELAGRHRHEAHDRAGGDALAGAGLTDQPQHFARPDLEVHTVDRSNVTRAGPERNAQVFDLEQWRCDHRCACRGSSTSRSPSPSKLNPRTARTMARPAANATCGEVKSTSWPSESIVPQSAVGGCTPSPRNDSAARSSSA